MLRVTANGRGTVLTCAKLSPAGSRGPNSRDGANRKTHSTARPQASKSAKPAPQKQQKSQAIAAGSAKPSSKPSSKQASTPGSKRKEDDMLFDEVSKSIKDKYDDIEDDEWDDDKVEAKTVGKGFGFGASSPPAMIPASSSTAKTPAGPALHPDTPKFSVFLHCADQAKTVQAISDLGWETVVHITTDLNKADALLSAKLTTSGKHQNLQQGERTARNRGIPFVVVGRAMSATTLSRCLLPLLDAKRSGADLLAAAGGSSTLLDKEQLSLDELRALDADPLLRHQVSRKQVAAALEQHRAAMNIGFRSIMDAQAAAVAEQQQQASSLPAARQQ